MTYDCMTPAELASWRAQALEAKRIAHVQNDYDPRPCVDCPMWFHEEEKAAGRCHSRPSPSGGRQPGPKTMGRPRISEEFEHLFEQSPGRGHRYEFEDERVAARRQTWRDYKRRLRGSQAPRIGAQS